MYNALTDQVELRDPIYPMFERYSRVALDDVLTLLSPAVLISESRSVHSRT